MSEEMTFRMIPDKILNDLAEMAKNFNKLAGKVKLDNNSQLGDWITESEAQKMLGRKTTWFYNMRKSGELTGRKRGNKWWYAISEILKFIEK
jgi:hypothetical protein